MKLNPPASSSDIDVARQIARRLHQNRRKGDRSAWPPEEPPRAVPPSARIREADPAAPWDSPAPPASHRPPAPATPRPPAAPPAAHAPAPLAAVGPEIETEVQVEAEAATAPPETDQPEPRSPLGSMPWDESGGDSASTPLDDLDAAEEPPAFRPAEPSFGETGESELAEADVAVEVDELPSQEQLVGEAPGDEEDSPLERLGAPDDSPFDDSLLDAPPLAEEPGAPSWEDVVESCRELAQAKGAMLVDPAGQVFAARGEWPAPGPDAIAAKLVAMMAKTLRDAPTRSISAPLMGMHLTAWRVPLPEGLVTAAFIGPAPVRSDTRPAIDQAITAAGEPS
jgi:hypothetical protein